MKEVSLVIFVISLCLLFLNVNTSDDQPFSI